MLRPLIQPVQKSVVAGFSGMTAVGSLFGDAAGGQVQVARGRASLVFASNGAGGPALLGMVTDADPSITLSGTTTAHAAMFLSSLVFTTDPAEATARLLTLATLEEVSALASIIQTEVQAGLLDLLPGGRSEDARMLALNILLAVSETLALINPREETVSSAEWANFLVTLNLP